MSPTWWNAVTLVALAVFAAAPKGSPAEWIALGFALALAGRGVVDGEA